MPCSGPDDVDLPPPLDGARLLPMADADLTQVMAIEERSFPSPWRRHHFQYEMHENRWSENYVIRVGSRVLGYASVWSMEDEFKINNFAIDREFRRRGLGAWLLRRLLARARRAGCPRAALEVRVSNRAAIRLYEQHGFVECGRRRNYYQMEGEDAILMAAELDPP
jgi:ribosomal-protein-alanine N-acetyltransferase